jgi:multidrug efflux pump subunit AcrA (membrane-fusion protein)
VAWTAAEGPRFWRGTLDRLVAFDPSTRTVTAAIRLEGDQLEGDGGFPLTPGMFCEVRLPGREVRDVFVLPRVAVTFDGHAYISDNGRLKTVKVEVLRSEGEQVIVRGGLRNGDRVIVTRLVAPLEGALLTSVEPDDA